MLVALWPFAFIKCVNAAADVVKVVPPIGPSSELTHAGRPYELTLLVSTVLVLLLLLFNFVMHCIISTVVVAFEINYLILSYARSLYVTLCSAGYKINHSNRTMI